MVVVVTEVVDAVVVEFGKVGQPLSLQQHKSDQFGSGRASQTELPFPRVQVPFSVLIEGVKYVLS